MPGVIQERVDIADGHHRARPDFESVLTRIVDWAPAEREDTQEAGPAG
jgi:hypothetical protein